MVAATTFGFEISISARDDGAIEAMYIRVNNNKVARTAEVPGPDEVLADYDSRNNLVGIEILSPVKLAKIVKLIEQPRRKYFRKFVRTAAPPEFVNV